MYLEAFDWPADGKLRVPSGGKAVKKAYLLDGRKNLKSSQTSNGTKVQISTRASDLNWPPALDARDVDCTLLCNGRGTLLPRNWPKEYYPIRSITAAGKIAKTDHSLLQSNVIESWSMSWWGFQKGKEAAMIIVETPGYEHVRD